MNNEIINEEVRKKTNLFTYSLHIFQPFFILFPCKQIIEMI